MIQEFLNLQRLTHPNIVKMHEIYFHWNEGFQSSGEVCVVMEMVNGREMFESIKELGHYSGKGRMKVGGGGGGWGDV